MQNQLFPYDVLRITSKNAPSDTLIINEIFYIGHNSPSKAILFYLEIKNPPKINIDNIITLPNQILRGFHRNNKVPLIEQFENGLEFLNTFFTETLPEIENNVNFVIALVDNDLVHFTHFGDVSCAIVSNDSVKEVSKFKVKPPIDEISSGKLLSGQWFIIANGELKKAADDISLDIWQSDELSDISYKIKSEEEVNMQGFFVRYQPNVVRNQITHYTDQPSKGNASFSNVGVSDFKQSFKIAGENIKSLKKPLEKFSGFLTKFRKTKAGKLGEQMVDEVKDIVDEISPEPPKPKSRFAKIWGYAKSPLVIGLAIVIIFFASFFAYKLFKNDVKDAKQDIASSNTSELAGKLTSATPQELVVYLNSTAKTTDISSLSTENKTLLTKILKDQDITLVESSTPTNTLTSPALKIGHNTTFIAADDQGLLWKKSDQYMLKLEVTQKFPALTSLESTSDTTLLIAETGNKVTFINDKNTANPITIPTTTKFSTDSKIFAAKYSTNAYLYAAKDNLMLRSLNFKDQTSEFKSYSVPSLNTTATITDLAINGNFIFATSDGKLIQVNKKVVTVMPFKPFYTGAILNIEVGDKWPKMYASSGKMIYTLDATGNELEAKYFAIDSEITDISLDVASKVLWIVSGKDIYQLPVS